MARNPTTKSQVQAYQFVLRRMESALVRKDAVMLHEPMRTHLRAAAVGLIIGVLGVAAFFVVGLFAPDDDLGDSSIVVGKQSGAIYVVQQAEPRRLIPVRNLASARLLLASPAFSSGAGPAGAAEVKAVEDSSLADLPRAPLTGIEGAPAYLPGPDRQVDPEWAVCDTAPRDVRGPTPAITTTALVGVPRPGQQLGEERALLAEAATGTVYLLFDGKRARANLADPAVRNAFGLADIEPRPVSTSLLNAIPESDALVPPEILGAGDPAPFPGVSGQDIGDVFQVDFVGGPERYYLILAEGKQRVTRGVANLIRYDRSNDLEIPLVTPEDSTSVPDAPRPDQIDFTGYPEQVPEIVPVAESRVACLTWTPPGGQEPATTITISDQIELDGGMLPVDVLPSVPGEVIADEVFLPPSKGALVRGVVPGQDPGSGAIFLVTDQGYRYGIPTIEVAKALGLGERTQPAPEAILDLLPIGPPLDPQAALELFDPQRAAELLQEQLATG
ncbi:MAG TPA: type VII secretion protein EccB [Pseudonocardiaceae bacterium]|jgi:type VII secretion protein EccB|nr:type VII secretion protein EccB [Pseudonocardiaceae bacterium]